jgi:hypothetical protein
MPFIPPSPASTAVEEMVERWALLSIAASAR